MANFARKAVLVPETGESFGDLTREFTAATSAMLVINGLLGRLLLLTTRGGDSCGSNGGLSTTARAELGFSGERGVALGTSAATNASAPGVGSRWLGHS